MTTFYVPLESGYWKLFCLPFDSSGAARARGGETFAKLGDSIFFHDDRSLYVNLFVPARLQWPEKGLVVRQETRFPDATTRSVSSSSARSGGAERAQHSRSLLGHAGNHRHDQRRRRQEASAKASSYWVVERTWKNGDRLDVRLPMSLHVHAMPDDPTVQAFMYGPLVLAGELGNQGLSYGSRRTPTR